MARVLIEEFPHRPGGHCGSTAMRDLLKFYGHDYTEDMVFGLGAGIDFMYINRAAMEPPVYVGGRAPELERNICACLGVGIELVSGLDSDEGWRVVRGLLDEGTPVMVHADVFHLDYLRAKRHFSAHRIVLVGYDDEKGVAFVADNDRDTIQECTLENLAKARSSTHLPRPAENAYYRFEVPRQLTPLEEAVPTSITEAVRHSIGLPEAEASFTFGDARIGLGVAGLVAFAADMPGFTGSMTPGMLSLTCKNIYVSAEKGGTGYGGNFRRMYGRFLAEASGIPGNEALRSAGEEFIEIGDLWTELSLTFKNLSSDGAAAIEKAHPIALEIARREPLAFAALDDFVRGCGTP
ncbi:MAG: BtrH N-terminal domain-containing protein [Candidatus Geothermincolia bacterium]